jgi:hypothetical protein
MHVFDVPALRFLNEIKGDSACDVEHGFPLRLRGGGKERAMLVGGHCDQQ